MYAGYEQQGVINLMLIRRIHKPVKSFKGLCLIVKNATV